MVFLSVFHRLGHGRSEQLGNSLKVTQSIREDRHLGSRCELTPKLLLLTLMLDPSLFCFMVVLRWGADFIGVEMGIGIPTPFLPITYSASGVKRSTLCFVEFKTFNEFGEFLFKTPSSVDIPVSAKSSLEGAASCRGDCFRPALAPGSPDFLTISGTCQSPQPPTRACAVRPVMQSLLLFCSDSC